MTNRVVGILVFFLLASFSFKGYAQNNQANLESEIRQLITQGSLQKAEETVSQEISLAKSQSDYNKLSKLVYWLGKTEITTYTEKLFTEATELFEEIKRNSNSKNALFHAHLGISKLYNEQGNSAKAFEIATTAKAYASSLEESENLVNVLYALGEYGLRSGNINTFEENTRKAHDLLQSNPEVEYEVSPRILNHMGALMYLTSKPDSALFFYNKALTKIDVMEKNSENLLYFPAAVKANMVLLKQAQNKYEEALQLANQCIYLNNEFLSSEKNHPLRFRVQRNLSLAYRNLVSLYEQIGDYGMCERIANLAYHHAKTNFEPQLLEYFSAVTLLAETKTLSKDFEATIQLCKEAEQSLTLMQGQNPLLKANLYTILAAALYGKEDYNEAIKYFELGNEFHDLAQEGTYSSDRLFAMMNLALSYAHVGEKNRAQNILKNAYTGAGDNGRLRNAVLVAQAKAGDLLKDYDYVIMSTKNFLASQATIKNIATDANKAQMIALNAKAIYHLNPKHDQGSLRKLAKTLDKAVQILEKRKAIIATQNTISDFIQEHTEVFDFGKKINLELYQLTSNTSDLKNVLNFHESSVYNKIRSRLNLSRNTASFKLEKKTALREKELREKINSKIEDATTYLKTIEEWNLFLDSLKTSNPKYHKMRYATISIPLSNLKQQIPNNTTLVRYFFIHEQLYAYVSNPSVEKLIPLPTQDIEIHMEQLSANTSKVSSFSEASKMLYKQLWQPLSAFVNTDKIIIFPDRELFNLNFELLSPDEINSFEELSENSLLSRFSISYNYSLSLLDENKRVLDYDKDFIAFVPEFTTSMKNNYQLAISDSINLDKVYLTLLPQPFISEVAERFSKKFKGSSFLNEKASKQVFTKSAKEHKIIHIGTHAESNNISPELSRLVFAKNVSDSTIINDNYLYTYEIYNQDLSSNLAILTACETGKPTYQPGEGMISLAHAFNYAGSESILTSLWQIDEQSSTQILEYFYTYLEKGFGKDEALRNAKLDYLANAEGRTVHPQYWAGLVLMGDTSPIELSSSLNYIWYSIVALLGALTLLFIFWKRKSLR